MNTNEKAITQYNSSSLIMFNKASTCIFQAC